MHAIATVEKRDPFFCQIQLRTVYILLKGPDRLSRQKLPRRAKPETGSRYLPGS